MSALYSFVDEAPFAAAFSLWESRLRAEPSDFLTADETARMAIADVSTARAIYFLALLREVTSICVGGEMRSGVVGKDPDSGSDS